MKIQLLYLSDLHIKDDITCTDTQIKDLVKSLKTLPSFDTCIILISGDIAFSGKKKEYSYSEHVIELLRSSIKKEFNLTYDIQVVLVPGNHDNNYKGIPVNRNDIAKTANKETAYKKELSKLTNYFNFAVKYNCGTKNKIGEVNIIDIDGYRLQFIQINSAIYSAFKDNTNQNEKGLHYIPRRTLELLEQHKEESNCTLYISHHSPEWFDEDSKHLLEEFIDRNASIALWGHEHYNKVINSSLFTLKGGVLSGDGANSDFYSLLLCTEDNSFSVYHFSYNIREKMYIFDKLDSKDICINQRIIPTSEFINETIYTDDIYLHCHSHDVFVFPRIYNKTNSFDLEEEINDFEQLFEAIETTPTCILSGSDSCGKSTFLKELYLYYVKMGKSPLFLTPDSLKNKKVDRIIKYNFYNQYGENEALYQKFLALPKDKKILIVDDIQQITTKKAFDDFLDLARNEFSKIILSTSMDEVDSIEIYKSLLQADEIIHLTIAPFYMDKRKQLISNILKTYKRFADSEIELYVEKIDTIIQSQLKFFSLTPQFITMFTDCYINQTFAMDGNTNVFNAVFQANITNKIKAISGVNVARSLKILQQTAYYIHINKKYPLPYTEFVDIVDKFNTQHARVINVNQLVKDLETVGIIKFIDSNSIVFTSKNYLAYFIAQAFNSKLGTSEGNDHIKEALANLCFGINADILLFLSFLTDRTDLIEFILKESDVFLQDWEEHDLDSANLKCIFVDFNAPLISYPTSKEKAQRSKDIVEHEKKVVKSETIKTLDIYNYNPDDIKYYVNKQTKVIKLLEIISKILPNFEHTLNKDELMNITDKIYSIPNKLVYYMLKPFDDNFEQTIDELVEVINENSAEDKQIDKPRGILIFQDFMTAVILSLYDFSTRLATSEETSPLLMDPKYSHKMCHKIQQCLVLYQGYNFEKLGKMIEEIYDNTKSQSIKFMMLKIGRNYLLKHNISYVGYGQKFIDKFFPNKELLMAERLKRKNLQIKM